MEISRLLKRSIISKLFTSALFTSVVVSHSAFASNQLNILNWSNYIGSNTVAQFEKETGIKVKYDISDSDDTLQAKLLSGNSGYDVVYVSSTYMAKQILAGVYTKLDWPKIANRVNLDPELMRLISSQDPGNQYGVPYFWGSDALIINKTKVVERLGKDVRLDTWDLLFKPEIVSKLTSCGVSMVDAPTTVFPLVLSYMGRNPNSTKESDYLDAARELKKIRPYITQFNSSVLDNVAGGDVCLSMGWSGDAGMISRSVREANQKFEVTFATPKKQTGLWFTLMGVPSDAPNKENAYKWINFLLRPEVAADITNETTYPMAVPAAKKMIKSEILADKLVYPDNETIKDFFVYEPIENKTTRLINRLWVSFKSGR